MYHGGKLRRCLLYIAMALAGILVIMFRNNAVYAFMVFAVFNVIVSMPFLFAWLFEWHEVKR